MQVENETNDMLSNERAGNLENNIFSWCDGCQHIRKKNPVMAEEYLCEGLSAVS